MTMLDTAKYREWCAAMREEKQRAIEHHRAMEVAAALDPPPVIALRPGGLFGYQKVRYDIGNGSDFGAISFDRCLP